MNLVFRSRLVRREWRLDETGIREFRGGVPYSTLRWFDLEGVERQTLHATNGLNMAVFLPKDRQKEFRAALTAEWQRRFPERFRASEARQLRQSA